VVTRPTSRRLLPPPLNFSLDPLLSCIMCEGSCSCRWTQLKESARARMKPMTSNGKLLARNGKESRGPRDGLTTAWIDCLLAYLAGLLIRRGASVWLVPGGVNCTLRCSLNPGASGSASGQNRRRAPPHAHGWAGVNWKIQVKLSSLLRPRATPSASDDRKRLGGVISGVTAVATVGFTA